MRLTKMSPTALAAVGAVTVLALAGCSGSANADGQEGDGQDGEKKAAESQGVVFDFTQVNGIPAAKEITFEIPDKLVKTDPKYSENRVLTSVTAKAHKLDSGEYCAIDFTYTYADGARDRVLNSKWYDRHGDEPTNLTPEKKIARAVVGTRVSPVFGEPDPSKPDFEDHNWYISKDLNTITSVVECATGPTDSEDNAKVLFNQIAPVSSLPGTIDVSQFASAEVSVMKNGDLNIPETKVDDWVLDANGDWVHD